MIYIYYSFSFWLKYFWTVTIGSRIGHVYKQSQCNWLYTLTNISSIVPPCYMYTSSHVTKGDISDSPENLMHAKPLSIHNSKNKLYTAVNIDVKSHYFSNPRKNTVSLHQVPTIMFKLGKVGIWFNDISTKYHNQYDKSEKNSIRKCFVSNWRKNCTSKKNSK